VLKIVARGSVSERGHETRQNVWEPMVPLFHPPVRQSVHIMLV
jgi:hypothetical protein